MYGLITQCTCLVCRDQLLQQWWDLTGKLLGQGRTRARELEEQIWRSHRIAVKVTPALRIIDSYGKEVAPEQVAVQL